MKMNSALIMAFLKTAAKNEGVNIRIEMDIDSVSIYSKEKGELLYQDTWEEKSSAPKVKTL